MRQYETEFKLKVVKSFLDGDGGARLLAWQSLVPEEKIGTWVSHYSPHGIDGLRPKRSKYSAQFKLQVLPIRTVSSFLAGRSQRSMTSAIQTKS